MYPCALDEINIGRLIKEDHLPISIHFHFFAQLIIKMAASIVYDDDPGDISCICGVVDQDIEGILLGYGRDDNKDLERLMVDECDKQILLNTREKVFVLAKEKILRCLGKSEAGKQGPDANEKVPLEEAALTASFIEKWQLISRRAEHKMAHDIIEMIAFTLGSKGAFPSKLLKEASLNKGGLPDSSGESDLVEMLRKDVETAEGNIDIQVVEVNNESQIHRINIPTTDEVDTPEQVNAQSGGNAEITPDETPPEGAASSDQDENPAVSVEVNETNNARPPIIHTDTQPVKPPSREVKVCACAGSVTKSVRDMACQTNEDERPIFRSEFDHQTEYANRKMRVNEQNIKGILKWKSLVNNRFRDVEKAHEREVIAMRAQYRTLAVELAESKARERKSEGDRGRSAKEPIVREDSEQMDVEGEWESNARSDDESVWDLQPVQSTPASTRPTQPPASTPRPKRGATAPIARRTQGVSRPPREGMAGPSRNSSAPARPSAQGSSQKAVRVDIEMIEVEENSSQSESSSEEECVEPVQKKPRAKESSVQRGEKGSGSGTSKTNQPSSLSTRLRALAETPVENDVEMSENDNSWADMEEEPMLVSITENEENIRGDDEASGERNAKNVRFNLVENKRGTKRGGAPRGGDMKRGELHKNGVNGSDDTSENSSNEHDSFADVVSRYGRAKIDWNKKRREAVATKKRSLKGIKSILQREVYIQGLDFNGFASYGEMEELVHDFCMKGGVPVLYMKIIPAKYDRAQVGCKLAVREMDFEKVMDEEFWPEDVSVREWRKKPRNGGGYEGFGEGGY